MGSCVDSGWNWLVSFGCARCVCVFQFVDTLKKEWSIAWSLVHFSLILGSLSPHFGPIFTGNLGNLGNRQHYTNTTEWPNIIELASEPEKFCARQNSGKEFMMDLHHQLKSKWRGEQVAEVYFHCVEILELFVFFVSFNIQHAKQTAQAIICILHLFWIDHAFIGENV